MKIRNIVKENLLIYFLPIYQSYITVKLTVCQENTWGCMGV